MITKEEMWDEYKAWVVVKEEEDFKVIRKVKKKEILHTIECMLIEYLQNADLLTILYDQEKVDIKDKTKQNRGVVE